LQGPYSARSNAARPNFSASTAGDQLDISAAAQAAIDAADRAENTIRTDLVARVKNEIAAGTYETAAKLDAAMERLLDDIA
jgi:anti-sigma28 factor (negative regulator of flagellin synthesis)